MKFNWFKKIVQDHPKFWETYLSYFDENKSKIKRYVVFDCETTGLNYKKDRILSIGAVGILNNRVEINDFIEVFVKQDIFNPETVAIHGILKEGPEKVVEVEALIRFLDFIKDATLVGHHVSFDIEMINQALNRMNLGTFKGKKVAAQKGFDLLKSKADALKVSHVLWISLNSFLYSTSLL